MLGQLTNQSISRYHFDTVVVVVVVDVVVVFVVIVVFILVDH